MIRVVTVLDPFRPGTQRITRNIEHVPGMMLDAVIRSAEMEPARAIAVIEGKGIPPELAEGFPVEDGGEIILMPYVGGGGFLRTFAEIGVLVAAVVASTFTAGIGGLGILAAAGDTMASGVISLVGAGVALAGNLLISAFMTPNSGGQDSATYDPTGPKTVASGGTPIPKGAGAMRWGGNIIASYVDAEGDNNYLNVLVCFGWGPASALTDIRLNNTSIEDYTDVTYQIRLGSNTQTPIPYFNNIVNGYPQAVRCIAVGAGGSPIVVQGTGTETQGLEVVIQFPTGVFYSNDDGSLRSLSIAYKVEYAVSGSGNWQVPVIPRTTHDLITYNPDGSILGYPGWVVVPTDGNFSSGVVYDHDNNKSPTAYTPGQAWSGTQSVTYYNADGSSYAGSIFLQGEWQPCDPNLNQQIVYDWSGGYVIFTDADQATLYHTTKIFNLPPNKYDVRVTKYGTAFAGDAIQPREGNSDRAGDQVWIHTINEVQYQDLAYPNMILLGVRALATAQLSGNGINITALVTHEITTALPSQLAGYSHDNPAVVAYDMLTADAALYGGGIDPSQIDLAALAQWAAYNDELVSDGFGGTIRRHVFNGVFDQQSMNLWKCLQKVGFMSNCIPVQIGRNYSFIVDGPVTVPAQVFTSANIKRDSIKDTWFSLDDRCNRVEITFADAGRDYRTDEPCAVMTPDDIQAGVEVKTTRVQLLGCTSRAQAWHWAYRKLIDTKTTTLTRTFDVNVDGVACQVGSVIGVQDDVTQWAEGGRIQSGSTSTALVIDRSDLAFATGQGWTISVVHPTLLRGSATVLSVVGNVVTFTANIPAGRVLRCMRASDGTQATVESYGASNVLLEASAGYAAGDVLSLYDQDVIDTQVVSAYVGSTITPASPFLQAPVEDSPWVYGQSAGAFPAKLFRVSSIKRKGDLDMTIDCVIYDPANYSDDAPIITEALGVPDVNATVTGLNLTENYAMANGGNAGQLSTISVGWLNGQTTAKTELWIAQNEPNQPLSSESLLVTVSKGTTYTFPAPTGAIVQIRAVGVDSAGTTASWNNAPVETITVQGSGSAPGDVAGFAGNFAAGTTTLTWAAATGAANYELRYNTDPNNSSWQTATLIYAGNALTFADTTIRGGIYLIKALSSSSVESINAAGFSLQASSSYLNALGLAPSQSIGVTNNINTLNGVSGLCSVGFTWVTQSLLRTDGTSVNLPAGSLEWYDVLSPSTTYYFYLRLRLSDMTLHSVAGDPPTIPDSSPNPTRALQSVADGYWQGPIVSVTTPSASGTGGTAPGGGWGGIYNPCPEAEELVKVRGKGLVRAGDVERDDYLLGMDISTGVESWRRVRSVRLVPAQSWYVVRGYRMSPLHDVWIDGEWRKPYLVGEFDGRDGVRAAITTDCDAYDDQNYFLFPRHDGERMLIHNQPIAEC